MSGILGIYAPSISKINKKSIENSINLAENLKTHTETSGNYLTSTSYLNNSPLNGDRHFINNSWIISFSGDLIGIDKVPFELIITALENNNYHNFLELEGIFGIIAYNKHKNQIIAISDSRSQKPLYYHVCNGHYYFSTHMSTLCQIIDSPEFDEAWLYHFLYFNFPINETSFIKNVKRMPPASVLKVDCNSGNHVIEYYTTLNKPLNPLLSGTDALKHACHIFSERIPKYFNRSKKIACALTGGWDGRTMLALAPPNCDITAYTYGTPGCDDLTGGEKTAHQLSQKHIKIEFDNNFINDIPLHAFETVFLSCGAQSIARSTLYYMYKSLTRDGTMFPLTISGISLDMQFRGHAQSPNLISSELSKLFSGAPEQLDNKYWKSVFLKNYNDFEKCINQSLEALKSKYGDFSSSSHHLSYIIYELSTKYFSGELSVADNFTTVRVPSWDKEIIKLSYSIEQSTLSYSQFLPKNKRGKRDEMILQSYIFKKLAPPYFNIPINGKKPSDILSGNMRYQLKRLLLSFKTRIRSNHSHTPPLSNWQKWLFEQNHSFILSLINNNDSLILKYINKDFIQKSIDTKNTHIVGKLLTIEITLRLLNNNWKRFW